MTGCSAYLRQARIKGSGHASRLAHAIGKGSCIGSRGSRLQAPKGSCRVCDRVVGAQLACRPGSYC